MQMLDMRKLLLGCVCSVALLAFPAFAGTDNIVNGSFDTDASSWTFLALSTATGSVSMAYYGTDGNPVGCALMQSTDTSNATNANRFYQRFPVVAGTTYYLRGQWKGCIYGTYGTNTGARNWAEVSIVFSAAPLVATSTEWTSTSPNVIRYKKRFGNGGPVNLPAANGQWGWESILSSPSTENAGPTDGAFVAPAGMNYMHVAFNVGGRASSVGSLDITNPTSVWFMVDNVHVCNAATNQGDLNSDCQVDFKDTAYVATQWLTCGLDPASSCW
jgi:hypothetical protein